MIVTIAKIDDISLIYPGIDEKSLRKIFSAIGEAFPWPDAHRDSTVINMVESNTKFVVGNC